MSNTPTSNDVKVVTDYANANGGNGTYLEVQAKPVLDAIHELYLSRNIVPCWSAQSKVEQGVLQAITRKNIRLETAALLNRSNENFVRVFVANFLSALHNGAYSVPKPDCSKANAPDGLSKLDTNAVAPPPTPPFDLGLWAKENPALAVGAVVGTGIIFYGTWKYIQHRRAA
jgi:hypothetical protein